MKSSRVPREKYGSAVSELFGSTNTFGWLAPLSTAGQPISISQNGFDCGTQSVGVAALDAARAVVVRVRATTT